MTYRSRLLRALACALALTGCSSPPTTSPPIRIRWSHDPETLDPLVMPNPQAVESINLIYCSLLNLDFSHGEFTPLLAQALPVAEPMGDSLLLLHYQLRPEARWDNGHPVLARDVAFTLKLMFCPGLPNETDRAQYSFIRAIRLDKAEPRRFTLVCRGQAPDFVTTSGDYPIVSEASLDPQGELRAVELASLQDRAASAAPDSALSRVIRRYRQATQRTFDAHPPGCGPYKLVSWEKDRALRFQRKTDWWGEQVPAGERSTVLQAEPEWLEYAIIPDDATASLALQRGELDVYPQVPAQEFSRLCQTAALRERLTCYTASSYDVVTAGFNTRRPALADAATRRALSRLFDAQGLLQATQLGTGARTVGLVNPSDRALYNDSLRLIPFDPSATATMLQQAGWRRKAGGWERQLPGAPPQHLALQVRYRSDDAMFETVALQFRTAAASIGIPVELQPTESSLLKPMLLKGDFDIYVRTLKGNPFVFNYAPLLHSQAVGTTNTLGYGSATSDRLIEAVAAATPANKAPLLRRLQAMLQAEAPLVPLFFLPTRIVASRDISGLHVTGLKPGYASNTLERASSTAAR